MSITIANYQFNGPFTSTDDLQNQSGVYVILGRNSANDSWSPVDAGESERVKERVETHDRKPCWTGRKFQTLAAATFYATERDRMALEKIVRDTYNFPCGKC